MKFVEDHFTKQHLFHKPHKWFLAFLISPLHAAEMHYKRKYHLTFRHAKKLFFFDMLLLASMFVLIGGTFFWYTYDPTVLDLVMIESTASKDRIQSGESVTYTFTYQNQSDVTLENVTLSLDLPNGFIIESTSPAEQYQDDSNTFALTNMSPGSTAAVQVTGHFFDIPEQANAIEAHLSYTQMGREKTEVKTKRAVTTLRGSVLKTDVSLPETILGSGEVPIEITLKNEGDLPLKDITLPLPIQQLSIVSATTTRGSLSENAWNISSLNPNELITLRGILRSRLNQAITKTDLILTPSIAIDTTRLDQAQTTRPLRVAHPSASLTAHWLDDAPSVSPGDTQTLTINMTNTGDTPLSDLQVHIPLPGSIINIIQVRQQNLGTVTQEGLLITSKHLAALSSLAPHETKSIEVTIPIVGFPQGTDISLKLTPSLSASVAGVTGQTYRVSYTTPPLAIGTQLLLDAEVRYYTDEGDQLGRGPLPPTVGEETKYWSLIRITNGSSEVRNMRVSATLPAHISWTGRTSVSHGDDLSYDPQTRQISWSLPTLSPHQRVGLNAELSFTPQEIHRGTTPLLLKNIRISAHDSYIDTSLVRTQRDINTSLENDPLARKRGVIVE